MTRLTSSEPRRAFLLKICAGAASLAGLADVLGARTMDDPDIRSGCPESAKRKDRRPIMLDELTAQDVAPHVGSMFHVKFADGSTARLELIEARELEARGDRPTALRTRQPFSIVFRVPTDLEWRQRVHVLGHAELGELEIFLVPIGPFPGEARLEAIFG